MYCRVSTKEELQQYSLESQKEYYKELIESNPDFILVGIYREAETVKDRVTEQHLTGKNVTECSGKINGTT